MSRFAFVPHGQQRRFRSARALGVGIRPTLPPMDFRFFHYPSATFLGVPFALVPNMQDSARLEAPKLSSAFAGYVAAIGLADEEVAEIGEGLAIGTFWEAAAGAALAVGIYEVAKHIYAHEKTTHVKSTDHYRCRLVAEVRGDNGEMPCAYVCKGYGALATFPLPGWMTSCPEGFNGSFPGP